MIFIRDFLIRNIDSTAKRSVGCCMLCVHFVHTQRPFTLFAGHSNIETGDQSSIRDGLCLFLPGMAARYSWKPSSTSGRADSKGAQGAAGLVARRGARRCDRGADRLGQAESIACGFAPTGARSRGAGRLFSTLRYMVLSQTADHQTGGRRALCGRRAAGFGNKRG